jgi:SAM-dependent methyltransferase
LDSVDWYEIAERDHDLQNPTSVEKIRLLGEYLRLGRDSRVLDVACGKAGPALILASTFGCSVTGVELRAGFVDAARARVSEHGLESLVEIQTADAREYPLEPETWDAALCLGATFVWGNIRDAAAELVPALKRGSFVAIGEPFWRAWPLPDGIEDHGYVDLSQTVARFAETGVAVTGVIAADEDDWDRYESLHWRALEEWLATHPEADEFRDRNARARADYFGFERALLGWAIFVGRRP